MAQCRVALGLSASLQQSAKAFFEQRLAAVRDPDRAAGVGDDEQLSACTRLAQRARRRREDAPGRGAERRREVQPIAFSADDSQFLQQRELSTREVARIFRVPAWAIDGATGDSLTYANVREQNRALVTYGCGRGSCGSSARSRNDTDLCPGNTYVQFDLDGLLRADAATRAPRSTRGRSIRTPAG